MASGPLSFSDITLEFLQDCLIRDGFSGEELTSFSLSDIPEPGQTAAMTFINLEHDSKDPPFPSRLVAKQKTDFGPASELIERLGGTKREVAFYANMGGDCQMDVPRGFYGNYEESTGDFLLIMEDRSGPLPGDWVTANLDQAQGLLKNLGKMHGHWWQSSEIQNSDWAGEFSSKPGCIASVMQQTFQQCALSFVEVFKDEINDEFATLITALCNKPAVIKAFDETANTFVHGDYHYKNAFFPEEALPIVFDWQDCGYGTPTVDIARLFIFLSGDGVDKKIDQLLAEYHQSLVNAGVEDFDLDQLKADMAIGYIYNTWLNISALMETDINLIRQVIESHGGTLQQKCTDFCNRTHYFKTREFIEAW